MAFGNLGREDLWELVLIVEATPTGTIAAEIPVPCNAHTLRRLRKKALSIVGLLIMENITPFILNIADPKECGKCSANDYDTKNSAKRLAIRNNVSNLGMEERARQCR